MIEESGSSAKPQLTSRSGSGIHAPNSAANRRSSAGSPASETTEAAESRNATPTVAHAMIPTARRDRRFPNSPLIATPISGMRGISQNRSRITPSPLHQMDVIEMDRGRVAHDRDQDRQTYRDLPRRDADHEHDEHLTGDVGMRPGECDEVEVRGVEHQLDRHQDEDRVAA